MIYIKNTTETQTIFIPRNELQKEAYVTSTKTYEDGYRDGLEDGKEFQKDQLLNLYVTENGQYEREDGWGTVTVDVPTEGGDCSEAYDKGFEDGYNQGQSECEEVDCSGAYEEGYDKGKNDGYDSGYQDGYNAGQPIKYNTIADIYGSSPESTVNFKGFVALSFAYGSGNWILFTDHTGSILLKNYQGLLKVGDECVVTATLRRIDNTNISFLITASVEVLSSNNYVVMPTDAVELTNVDELYIPNENGYAEMKYLYVDGKVGDRLTEDFIRLETSVSSNGNINLRGNFKDWVEKLKEGDSIRVYMFTENSLNAFVATDIIELGTVGGSCNLEDKWITPSMSERDDNGLIVVDQSEGYDGLDRVVIDPTTIYNEGVEEGKKQGGGSCTLEDKRITPTMGDRDGNGYIVVEEGEGYDGLSRVVIDPQQIYNEGIEEGRNQGGGESGSCILEDKILSPSTSDIVGDWLNVWPSEGYDGMFNVSINVNGLKDEWSNSEDGSIQETKWVTPSTNDVDDNGFITFNPDDGYDAMNRVAMDVSTIKSEWLTMGKNSIADYYWCPITVSDSGIGERAKSFSLADEQTVYDENDVLIDRNDMFYLPTANNLNEFRLTKKATKIVFPFNDVDAQYISNLYLNDDVKVFSCMDKNLSLLSTIEVGKNVTSFVLSNCNLLRLNKIVVHSNNNCDVLLTYNVKSTGTLYINEYNDFKNNWINALPSGWTVEYL